MPLYENKKATRGRLIHARKHGGAIYYGNYMNILAVGGIFAIALECSIA